MNALLDIALTNAAIATVLAAGVAFVTWRFRFRPAVRHALWLLVLIKLIAPPLVQVRLKLPTKPELAAATEPVVAEVASLDDWTEARMPEPTSLDVVVWTEPVGVTGLAGTPVAPVERPLNGATGVPLGPATRVVSWRQVVAATWLTGSIVWLSAATIRIVRFGRVLRDAKPATESVCEHVTDVAARLGLMRAPRVVMTSGTVSPLIWGFGFRPKLLIPNNLWSCLSQEQRTTLLIHELAHLRRGDHLVRLLELVVTGVYWWHPVSWWARRAIRDAEEQCCDAWVVWAEPKSARSYATALLETVEFLSRSPGQPFAAPAAATGLGHVDHLKRRLTMILRGTTPRRLSLSGALAILGLAGVLLPLAPIAAQEEAKPKDEAEESIKRLDVVPTVVGTVTVEEGKPLPGALKMFARLFAQDDVENPKPGTPERPSEVTFTGDGATFTVTQDKGDGVNPDKVADEEKAKAESSKNDEDRKKREAEELDIARLRKELADLQARQEQVTRELQKRLASIHGGDTFLSVFPPQVQVRDGSTVVFGKPGSDLVFRRMRIHPDGRQEIVTENVVGKIEREPFKVEALTRLQTKGGSPEEMLKAEKAALEEVLKKYPQAVKDSDHEPGIKHVKNQLAEIEARLRAIEAPKSNPEERIDVLEKKLDSVLDELKRLKSGGADNGNPLQKPGL